MEGKICLLRVDLNIEPGQEKNTNRLDAIIPTIQWLLKKGNKVVLLSHRGRPNPVSKIKNQKSKLTLKPFAPLIANKIGAPVIFIKNFGKIPEQGKVFLFENLRFWPGEKKNDPAFAKKLAGLGDFYINDAFAVCHRKNASIVAITKYLPSFAGPLLKKEIKNLNQMMKNYRHPMSIIIGGAKISDKIGIIKYFWRRADYFLLGGGPANTFFAARGLPVGDSLVDRSMLGSSASPILSRFNAGRSGFPKLILPVDVKISDRKILDIGEQTVKQYAGIIKKSRTIIWNGPMGLYERRGFEKGTIGIWKAILANRKAQIVVGGGETIASLKQIPNYKFQIKRRKNIFLSTGGGAMLEYLSGKKLPGIEIFKGSI